MNQAESAPVHPSSFSEDIMSRSRYLVALAVVSTGIGLAWVAWFLVGGWQVRDGLAKAKQQFDSGQYGPARDRLARLSTWWPRQAEVDYLLGECEARLGRPDAALAAWARVPPGSSLAVSATLARGRALVRLQGRFIEAEAAYREAIQGGTGARGRRGPLGSRHVAAMGGSARRSSPGCSRRSGASDKTAIGSPRSANSGGWTPWSSRPKKSNRGSIRPR